VVFRINAEPIFTSKANQTKTAKFLNSNRQIMSYIVIDEIAIRKQVLFMNISFMVVLI